MDRVRRLVVAALAVWTVEPALADDALDVGPVEMRTARTTVRLVSEATSVAPGAPLTVALVLTLDPGWHTYWLNPGDAGAPPRLDWTVPAGVTRTDSRWPAPQVFREGPITTFGHDGEAWVLSRFALPERWESGTPATFAVDAEWLVCADICIPEHAALALPVPVAAAASPPGPAPNPNPDPAHAAAFAAARAALAGPMPGPATLSGPREAPVLTVDGLAPPPADASVWFFPDTWGIIEPGGAQLARWQEGRLRLRLPPGIAPLPAVLSGVLRIGTRAVSVAALRTGS